MSPGQKIKTETEMPPCSCRQLGSPLDSGTGEILQEGKCSPEDRDTQVTSLRALAVSSLAGPM